MGADRRLERLPYGLTAAAALSALVAWIPLALAVMRLPVPDAVPLILYAASSVACAVEVYEYATLRGVSDPHMYAWLAALLPPLTLAPTLALLTRSLEPRKLRVDAVDVILALITLGLHNPVAAAKALEVLARSLGGGGESGG